MKRRPGDFELPQATIDELEALRPLVSRSRGVKFTPEMDAVLVRARSGPRPIKWNTLSTWWKARGWQGWADSTLRRRLDVLQSESRAEPE